MPSRREAECEI